VKVQRPDSPPADFHDVPPRLCEAGNLMSLHIGATLALLDGTPVDEHDLSDVLRARRELEGQLGWEGSGRLQQLTVFVEAGILKKRLRRYVAIARGAGYRPDVVVVPRDI
jgi:hypothetical protein